MLACFMLAQTSAHFTPPSRGLVELTIASPSLRRESPASGPLPSAKATPGSPGVKENKDNSLETVQEQAVVQQRGTEKQGCTHIQRCPNAVTKIEERCITNIF